MRIQEMIQKLQTIFEEQGNLQVMSVRDAGDFEHVKEVSVYMDGMDLPRVKIETYVDK